MCVLAVDLLMVFLNMKLDQTLPEQRRVEGGGGVREGRRKHKHTHKKEREMGEREREKRKVSGWGMHNRERECVCVLKMYKGVEKMSSSPWQQCIGAKRQQDHKQQQQQ